MDKLIGRDISKEYPGGITALKSVNIEIHKGDIVVVMGPSGSGKTTLINILGLLDTPTAGNVYLDDREITGLSEKEKCVIMNRTFGFIFQFFYLIPELTAIENVMLPLWIKERSYRKVRDYYRRAEELLVEFNLSKRKDAYPSQLSGGEMQKVAICRSLICSPEIIFADEPTGSIDKESSEMFFNFVQLLNKKKGIGFFIGTHNEKFLQFATKVVYLNQGEIE
ncbi:MAG: ABC transporter ATP-binding protein [Candidatus Ratteibacteria bacterium]|nr:ABC transporter ATP-binding protein [Candidatus Ratteibacteria bacterium]